MMRMRYLSVAMLVMLLSATVLAACDPNKGRDAKELLPNISENEYDIIHNNSLEESLQGTLVGLQAWELLSADPSAIGKVLMIDDLLDCTAKTGALAARFYINKQYRYVTGAAVVVNVERLNSWQTAAECLRTLLVPDVSADAPPFQPCANWWEYKDSEATYYLFFAATSPELCTPMCNSMLGCPGINKAF